jgi:hypothetical protein
VIERIQLHFSSATEKPSLAASRAILMTISSLANRIRKRGQHFWRRLFGLRLNKVLFISVSNASEIASKYSDVQAETLVESRPLTTLIPKCVPGDELPGLRPFRDELQTVLLDVRNPTFSFRNHVVLDGELNVLFSPIASAGQILTWREYAPRAVKMLRGTVAYLSNTWVDNYYHWMQLTLPLIRLYRLLRAECKIDYYYIGETRLLSLQLETLSRLGISREQVITQACSADRMLALFCLRPEQHCGFNYRDSFGHEFTRALLVPPEGSGTITQAKRLYVSRGAARTRRVKNEDDVIAALAPLGFQTVRMDGLSAREQANLFWNADIIVGLHGAALTNLIFARHGTKVIELFPHDFHEPGMFTAATHSHLDYYHLRAEAPLSSGRARSVADEGAVIRIEKLLHLIETALSEPTKKMTFATGRVEFTKG